MCILSAALIGTLSLSSLASANSPQATASISFTITTTTNYPVQTGGVLQVNFNSVQLDTISPQAYSFGVNAKTFPGLWITRLQWQFGDGAFLNVPYCCQSQVSEVQYHAYAPPPQSYTVVVLAFDNAGNFGGAAVTVNWTTPVPEYPSFGLPVLASILIVLATAAYAKGRRGPASAIFR